MLVKPVFGRLFFSPDDGSGGGGGGAGGQPTPTTAPPADPATPPTTGEPAKVTFTPEQQAAIDALIGTARKEGKAAAEKAANDAKAAADAERARNEAEAKGEFETVKTSLVKERDDAIGERDGLKAKVESYEKLAAARVEEAKKALPAEALEDFPADADPLAQLEWLTAREKLIASLGIKPNGEATPKLPKTPGASEGKPGPTKEQEAELRRQYKRW